MATQTKIPQTVRNPWWGHKPSDKQWLGLYAYEECPDLFYGGAAGPGKTSFLLMAAAQYVHYPHYRALILRKTYADLSLPDAIMDRANSWWDGVEGARFNNQEKVCYFPSGAQVQFGYLASARDHLRYQGAAVHFVGIDEASQPTFPIWLNIPLSKSSAFFKPLSICETLAVGMAIITP